jgi:hypothetical protein
LIPVIFIRLGLDGLAGIQFIFKGKFQHCWAIIKAHFAFYALISKNLKKRSPPQQQNYYHVRSIVYNYFVKNGKIFEDNI